MASPAHPGGNRTPVLFASVVIALIALAGVAAFSFQQKEPLFPTYTGAKSTTTEAASGLLLGLSISQTAIGPGQTVGITVYERNSLGVVNKVPASDRWPVKGLGVGACGPLNLPVGIVVFRGNVSVSEAPGEQPLQLYEPGAYACPMILSGIDAYVFQPMSSEAQVVGSCSPNPCLTLDVSSTVDARGYWGTTFLQSSFTDFAPGIYTVLAGDEWGDVAVLQFSVSSANPQVTGSSETCAPAATVTQTLAGTTTTQTVTLCHSVSTYAASNTPTQGSGEGGLELSSIVMISQYTPAGPTLALTLRNLMGCCVTNLTAVLVLGSNYTFQFQGVSTARPLGDAQYASSVETLVGGGFESATNYTLVVKGTTQDAAFAYAFQTYIPSGYSHLLYLSASCAADGGTAPCWGGDPFIFQCTDLLAGPAAQWTCTEKVTSTIEPGGSYSITVTLPVTGQTGEPGWDNCEWSAPNVSPGQGYAYCIPVSSSGGSVSFILAEQAPPHP